MPGRKEYLNVPMRSYLQVLRPEVYFPRGASNYKLHLKEATSVYKIALVLSSLGVLLISTSPAYAYLDPGTGSMMLQLLLGGVAALLVIVKLYWHRFLRLFRGDSDNIEKEKTDRPAGDS